MAQPAAKTTAAATTHYTLLALRRDATPAMIEAAFQRLIARYRPMTPIAQLVDHDKKLARLLNAYLVLRGPRRADYDRALKAGVEPPAMTPFDDLSDLERDLLTARMAYWRREMAELLHLLRQLTSRHPECAPAWALMGEFYLLVERVEEGVAAYEKAVKAAPDAGYAARLQHARDAQAGLVELEIPLSPEEEMLREERHSRAKITIPLVVAGALLALLPAVLPQVRSTGAMPIPWAWVGLQAAGIFLTLFGLGYGRILQPFERVMIWSAISAGDRGHIRSYPYGLILLVTALPSLWAAAIALFVMAMMDDEWPVSPTILLGACAVACMGLTLNLYFHGLPWGHTALFGGNLLVLAGMLGWWFSTLGAPSYD